MAGRMPSSLYYASTGPATYHGWSVGGLINGGPYRSHILFVSMIKGT
jgi:hypothetical protein